jgi:alkanesulfonate monooxygenase SsuD/methylene tetrahydromethanopterin reductase-like flavin-dependent oxidoreductase (luciferase family)
LAARTSTLRLGTLVTPVTFRHPAVVANAVATADHISGGRIELYGLARRASTTGSPSTPRFA